MTAKHPILTKLCPVCDFPFDAKVDYEGYCLFVTPREYCSPLCADRAKRGRKPPEKIKRRCKRCNKLFNSWLDYDGKPTIHPRHYCKLACRSAARSSALTKKYKKKIGKIVE
jgi:hypothetical protein